MSHEHSSPTSETRLENERSTSDASGYRTLANLSSAQKGVLLVIFCLAQFLDTYANSALFAAIPPIAVDLKITNSDSVWLISGYQLTFASLLLIVRLAKIIRERSTHVGSYSVAESVTCIIPVREITPRKRSIIHH